MRSIDEEWEGEQTIYLDGAKDSDDDITVLFNGRIKTIKFSGAWHINYILKESAKHLSSGTVLFQKSDLVFEFFVENGKIFRELGPAYLITKKSKFDYAEWHDETGIRYGLKKSNKSDNIYFWRSYHGKEYSELSFSYTNQNSDCLILSGNPIHPDDLSPDMNFAKKLIKECVHD